MFIKEEQKEQIFTRPKPRKPSEMMEYKRKKTIYHFKCDSCGENFTRDKGEMDSKRIYGDYKHICSECGPAASAKIGMENFKNNRLNDIPIGTVKKSWSAYPVIFIGYDNDDRYTKNAGSSGWARQHTYVMENHIGRKLKKGEVVHHIDGSKTNNNINNLLLCTVSEHNQCHAKIERLVFELYNQGLVGFDNEKMEYYFKGSSFST